MTIKAGSLSGANEWLHRATVMRREQRNTLAVLGALVNGISRLVICYSASAARQTSGSAPGAALRPEMLDQLRILRAGAERLLWGTGVKSADVSGYS